MTPVKAFSLSRDGEQIIFVKSGWTGKVTVIWESGPDEAWEPELLTIEEAEKRYQVDLSQL